MLEKRGDMENWHSGITDIIDKVPYVLLITKLLIVLLTRTNPMTIRKDPTL